MGMVSGDREDGLREALACFEEALSIDRTDRLAWLNKGRALWELRRFKPAMEAFERAMETVDPQFSEGDYRDVLKRATALARKEPRDLSVARVRLAASLKLGDWEGARKALAAAQRLSPGDPGTMVLRGLLEWEETGDESALDFIRTGLSGDRESFYAWLSLGVGEFEAGRYKEALSHLNRALELGPGSKEALAWRSRCIEKLEAQGLSFRGG